MVKEGKISEYCTVSVFLYRSRPKGYSDRAPDPYDYYRDSRYPPPPPIDRFRPYPDPYDRRPPLPRDPYYRDRDPYARPPPEYYGRRWDLNHSDILSLTWSNVYYSLITQ